MQDKASEHRPTWDFAQMSEDDFRVILSLGCVKALRTKWNGNRDHSSETWLEASSEDDEWIRMPKGWHWVLRFEGKWFVPGMFRLLHLGERMQMKIQEIDDFEKSNERELREYERLKAKFGEGQQRNAAEKECQPNENVVDTSTLSLFKVLHWLVKISTPTLASQRIVNSHMEQGLARGRLNVEELRVVADEAPRFAQALTDGMGLTYADLLLETAEGTLTTTALVKALMDQAPILAEEAGYQRINGVYVKEGAE